MKKNQKILGTLLLIAVALLSTMCNPKSSTVENDSQSKNKLKKTNSPNYSSLNGIEYQEEIIYDDFNIRPANSFTYKVRIYSNVDSLNSNVRLFVKINDGTEKRLNDRGHSLITINGVIIDDSVITKLDFFAKEESTPGNWTVIDTIVTKYDRTKAPILNPPTENDYFIYDTKSGWVRKHNICVPASSNCSPIFKIWSKFNEDGTNGIIVTWPPTVSK